jgi:hypothetical protein
MQIDKIMVIFAFLFDLVAYSISRLPIYDFVIPKFVLMYQWAENAGY